MCWLAYPEAASMRPCFWTGTSISYITPRMTQKRWNESQLVAICTNYTSSYNPHRYQKASSVHFKQRRDTEHRNRWHRPTRIHPKATNEQHRRASLGQSMQKHLVGYNAKPKIAADLPRYEARQPLTSIGRQRQAAMHPPRRSRTQSAFAGCRPTGQRLIPPVEHLPSIICRLHGVKLHKQASEGSRDDMIRPDQKSPTQC
ncbi:hypothetical protein HDV63DRAFT_205278 [Trichoderma sp. SZMC 28014]